MPSIIVNKIFNKRYLKNLIKDALVPAYNDTNAFDPVISKTTESLATGALKVSVGSVYDDNGVITTTIVLPTPSSSKTGLTAAYNGTLDSSVNYMCLITKEYIDLLRKINDDSIKGLLIPPYSTESKKLSISSNTKIIISRIMDNLISNNMTIRDGTIDYLASFNYITAEVATRLKLAITPLITTPSSSEKVVPSDIVFSNVDDVCTVAINRPTKLASLYENAVNNPSNSDLYLVVFSDRVWSYGMCKNYQKSDAALFNIGTNLYVGPESASNAFANFLLTHPKVVLDSTTSGKLEAVLSFIAFKVTDRDGDGDIKLDHIDRIRYFDNLTFKIKLPKQYS